MTAAAWSTRQLAEFLEIFEVLERESMLRLAIDRIAESLDAEVAALILDDQVVRSLGFPPDEAPVGVLLDLCRRRRGEVELAPIGTMHFLAVPVSPDGSMVVMRAAERFDHDEDTLLRSMGRALSIAMTAAASLDAERSLRSESERRAEENRRLATELDERQTLSTRLFTIQHAISHRAPLQEVLDSITLGASELLSAQVVGLRVQSMVEGDPPYASLVGYSDAIRAEFSQLPLDAGFAGRAFLENRLIVTDHYRSEPGRVSRNERYRLQSAMAAPVHVNGVPVGVLNVATAQPGRRFIEAEQDFLRALAEHASLAVSDASVVNQLRRSLEGATFQAQHDALTGLPNRSSAVDILDRALATATPSSPVCVLFIDLDRFKSVNDIFGHAIGDQVLVEVARRLHSAVRTGDHIARLSGDEFVIITAGTDATAATMTAERVTRELAEPILIGGKRIGLTASVGVAEATTPLIGEALLADADVAMYRAKQHGRARVVRFDQAMRFELLRRTDLEHQLHTAIDERQLVTYYQPCVSLDTGEVTGVEALIRWRHPTLGLILPETFIGLAEDTGLVAKIDQFVLNEACQRMAEWSTITDREFSVSVNISAGQCTDPALVSIVRDTLERTGLAPERLWLEITESVVLDDTEATLEILRELRAMGVRFMIDDFGTGYSSLVYLKRFPVDALKVDRAFVDGLDTDPEDEAIVTAIVRLADALGHAVVAEGVETVGQVEWLRRLGCTRAQGFLFCPPVDADVIREILEEGRRFGATDQVLSPVIQLG